MKTIEELITFLTKCRIVSLYPESDEVNKNLDEAIDFVKTLKTCNHLSYTDGICDYCGEKRNG